MYLFHILKLRISFKGSIFEIRKCVIKTLFVLIITICVGYFVSIVVIAQLLPEYSLKIIYMANDCRNISFIGYIGIILSILDAGLVFILTKLYTKRLNSLLTINMQYGLKTLYIKCIVLCITCILSNIIFILLPIINPYPYIKPYALFGIDLVINNTSFLLSFGKSNFIYNILCKCQRICITETKLQMTTAISQSTMTITPSKQQSSDPDTPTVINKSNDSCNTESVMFSETNLPSNTLQLINDNIDTETDNDIDNDNDNDNDVPDAMIDAIKITPRNDPIKLFVNKLTNKKDINDPIQTFVTNLKNPNSKSINTSIEMSTRNNSSTSITSDRYKMSTRICAQHLTELGIII